MFLFFLIINSVNFKLLKKPIGVISKGVNPTIFYWLKNLNFEIINPNEIRKTNLYKFKTIILARYVPFNIFFDLIKIKRKSKIVLLIDDNLLDLNIFSELPFLYKLKIFLNIYCFKYFFNFIINEIWVTNKRLGEKVKNKISTKKISINLLNLIYYPSNLPKKIFKIAYLGTSSHTLELIWLKKLFRKIQSERKDCLIEIYIDKKWRKKFRSIPRLKIMYPLDWETFYMDSLTRKVDIVLNPILSSEFNKYRSPTKFFDTTRFGAVGIYSNKEPFLDFINDNYDGILLENNIDSWAEKIYYLLDNPYEIEKIFQNAIERSANKREKSL